MSTEEQNSTPEPIGKIIDGTLDLTSVRISSLSCVGVQPSLEVLIVSDNELTSFKTLKPQPNLKEIVAASNPLECIDGLEKQNKLESVVLSETPISSLDEYRTRVLATLPSLKSLDGEEFTEEEVQEAKKIATNKPDQKIVSDEEKQKAELSEECKLIQYRMYMDNHKDQLTDFSKNEAELWDLTNNGSLPIITKFSSDEEIRQAIIQLRHRNAKIQNTFLNE